MFIILPSCELSVKRTDSSVKSKIRNGISHPGKRDKCGAAFLITDDDNLLPEDNKIKVNQKVRLRLIATGWTEKDGRIFLDAAEKVETSDGSVVLNQKDLFREYQDGLSPEDAKLITLSVVITQIDKLYDYYRVLFQVKDKSDEQKSVEGSYKFYIE
jgi:predicted pyridoxine 5'-phosphate oxidase superfamily flavin-nucleotide-binding protein